MAQRQLLVKIIGDPSSLQRAFATGSRSAKGFNSDLGKTSRGALSAAISFRGLGRSVSFASAQFLGGAGAVFALKSIIDETSRVQEETEKTTVVFGRNARQVQAWSKTLAESFGVSEGAALEATGRFGNMLIPLGFGQKAAAGMSERLVQLAADMASFNNTKPEVVLAALSSGLAGQVRPLRQYGVFLTQARIQQEAYADGIAKQGAKLTTAQKLQASYNIILKDTKNAQGDVARNTGSLSVAMSKLTAGIQDTESGLGRALLPTVTAYVNQAGKWLNNTENQKKLQHDFNVVISDAAALVSNIANVLDHASKAVGGFGNLVKLLIGLKVASTLFGWQVAFATTGDSALTASGKVGLLRKNLLGLGLISVAPIIVPIEIKLAKNIEKPVEDFLKKHAGRGVANLFSALENIGSAGILGRGPAQQIKDVLAAPGKNADVNKRVNTSGMSNDPLHDAADRRQEKALIEAAAKRSVTLTAAQRNTFFDNAISRILGRGGTADLQGQLAALNKASALLTARLAVTKDVTRKLNLEDQLIALAAQKKDVTGQIAQGIKDRLTAQREAAQALQQKQLAQLTSKQFRELGLTATGDVPTPQVANLKKRLAQITEGISGTKLDTPKLESQLARFRKVLSEGLVPKDVRGKIKELLDEISGQIKDGTGQLTKFKHTSSDALLSGLGLDGDTLRILKQRLAQVGAGGTVPGSRSQAFAAAGAGSTTLVVNLDGREIARNTTQHQRQANTRRAVSRSGPYAGRN